MTDTNDKCVICGRAFGNTVDGGFLGRHSVRYPASRRGALVCDDCAHSYAIVCDCCEAGHTMDELIAIFGAECGVEA